MSTKEGSLFGGVMFIGSSCLGLGMLALPILTGFSGFFPSMLFFILAWVFMTTCALYIVDVQKTFARPVHFISMVKERLGNRAMQVCWVTYLFLFYAILVACISGSGQHVQALLKSYFAVQAPSWVGSLFFTLLFGWMIYLGTKTVDHLNRILMFIKIAAFVCLIFVGVWAVEPGRLMHVDFDYAIFPFPILVIAFGFHNMIPTLYKYMGENTKRVKKTILWGSSFVLLVYIAWQIVALGIIPFEGKFGILESYRNEHDAATAIAQILTSSSIAFFAQTLAFFAILTSFLAQGMTLVHFLSDGLKMASHEKEHPVVCFLAVVPPLAITLIDPTLFFQALNFAGGLCAVLLFGLFPTWMILKAKPKDHKIYHHPLWMGLIVLLAVCIMFYQICSSLGLPIFTTPV